MAPAWPRRKRVIKRATALANRLYLRMLRHSRALPLQRARKTRPSRMEGKCESLFRRLTRYGTKRRGLPGFTAFMIRGKQRTTLLSPLPSRLAISPSRSIKAR